LQDTGFYPIRASQSNARTAQGQLETKHSIRFRLRGFDHADVGDVIPEIGLINSHNGTSAYELFFGLFRLICSNGMVSTSGELQRIRQRHSGRFNLNTIVNESRDLIGNAPAVLNVVKRWHDIELSLVDQEELAKKSIEAVDSSVKIAPVDVLFSRRALDVGNDLWTVFNRIQENITKGGLVGQNSAGVRSFTRSIRAVDRDLSVNRKLWTIADEFAQLRSEQISAVQDVLFQTPRWEGMIKE
jgi:hypothetical protein